MLESLRQTLCIWIDRHETVFVLRQGWLRRSARVLHRYPNHATEDAGLPMDNLRLGLEEADLSGIPVQVVVHEDWMRIWPVEPPKNASRLADLDAACAMRFEAIFDEPLHHWVWRSSPRLDHTFIACAMRRVHFDGLETVLRERRLHLVSLQARCAVLWNSCQHELSAKAWLGICADDSLTVCLANQGKVFQVRHVQLDETQRGDSRWFSEHVRREVKRFNLVMPDMIGLCGSVPEPWLRASSGSTRVHQLSRSLDVVTMFGVAR